jgi:uracil-DNA glycosylase family 4
MTSARLDALERRIVACERCPRLRAHCLKVAKEKRRAYAEWTYWGKPVPGFGDPKGRLFILGLAPGAHGANRTGRVFTGDRSGDFLFAALHRAGFANQPHSVSREDGLALEDAYVSAAVRCAPPANKPSPAEAEACREYLAEELALLPRVHAVLALGRFGHDAYLRHLQAGGAAVKLRDHPFAHGARHRPAAGPALFDTFHPSQQNTFTGRLKPEDLDCVLDAVKRYLAQGPC